MKRSVHFKKLVVCLFTKSSRLCKNLDKCEKYLCQFRHKERRDNISNFDFLIVENHKEIIYSCDQCNYETTDKDVLQIHKDLVHKVKLNCKYCEFVTDQNETLTLYIEENHDISCDQCGTRFVNKKV